MATTPQEDTRLLKKLKQGDNQAFRALFDSYYKYLVVTVNNILGDSETARDLAQDVLAELWKRRTQMQSGVNLKAYLRRAAINKTLNYIKARRLSFNEPEKSDIQATNQPSAQQLLERDDLKEIINDAIASLPEKCRMVFLLCRLEKLSHKEIAKKLNISTKTVENQMTKSLKILRKAIQPYLDKSLFWLSFMFWI